MEPSPEPAGDAAEQSQAPERDVPEASESTSQLPKAEESPSAQTTQRRPSQPAQRRATLISQYDELDWEKAYVSSAATGPAADAHPQHRPREEGERRSLKGAGTGVVVATKKEPVLPAPMLRAGQSRGSRPPPGMALQLTPYPPGGLVSTVVPATRSSSVPTGRGKSEPLELKQAPLRPNVATALLQRPVQEWQEEEVIRWLLEVSLAPKELAHVIREQAVTGNVLLTLTEKDFEELQVPKFGHRRLLMMAATELRAVVAHTRSKEAPQLASGPPLPVAVAARGAPAPMVAQAPCCGDIFHPAPIKPAPLVVKVMGHPRVSLGRTFSVPKAPGPATLTARPVVRSFSGGGLSSDTSPLRAASVGATAVQAKAPFVPDRGVFVTSPRDAVSEPLTAARTTRSLSPPLRPVVIVQSCAVAPRPGPPSRRLAWAAPGARREASPPKSTRMQL